jgi:hypothetical protein
MLTRLPAARPACWLPTTVRLSTSAHETRRKMVLYNHVHEPCHLESCLLEGPGGPAPGNDLEMAPSEMPPFDDTRLLLG